jgi:DNA-binding CsgD family transcriptional regulator
MSRNRLSVAERCNVNEKAVRGATDLPEARQREMVAELCRFIGGQLTGKSALPPWSNDQLSSLAVAPDLAPRVRQTLDRLLAGDSEKQIAGRLGLSRHTIHVYIKTLYRQYSVCTRGELIARILGTFDSATPAPHHGRIVCSECARD